MNLSEFFNMGGYAFYVWTSYGLALVVLMINLVEPRTRERRLLKSLARRVRLQRRSS
jgi:heme exporter protein D